MKRFMFAAVVALAVHGGFAAGECSLVGLGTEFLENPVGIDAEKPRFSWKVQDDRQDAVQRAWQLQVATSRELLESGPDVWDSGRQETSATVGIVYGGPALQPRTTYFWRVKGWDKDNEATEFSEVATWETGLLGEAWQGKWIAGHHKEPDNTANLGDVKWVWFPEEDPVKEAADGKRFFRHEFELPEKELASATSVAMADNMATLYVNGANINTVHGWQSAIPKDVLGALKPGKNLVQVEATNHTTSPAGMAWCVDLVYKDGEKTRISTDEAWKVSAEAGGDWPDEPGGTAEWVDVKVLGNVGMDPWKTPRQAVNGGPASLHRKDFEASEKPSRARLYITALGSYRAEINGKRVGEEVLTPEWTDYRDRVMYQAYDVTELVAKGDNAIGVMLGDGWYASALGWQLERYCFGEPPTRFIAELHLAYPDGTTAVVASDPTWKTAEAPVRRSELYYGEIYDARMEQAGWSSAGFDESTWKPSLQPETPAIEFTSQDVEPVRVTQEIKPIEITEPQPGVHVYDMGQNMVGWVRLAVNGKAGDRVRLRFAEILNPDGTIYRDNLRSAEATDTYILKGDGNEIFEPHFTFHGFRYVEMTGFPGTPDKDAILGRVIYSDVAPTGTIETSDATVNQVVKNTQWGLWGNFISVPTDCPQRDERLGWTGDAQAIWKTACYRMQIPAFSEKWLRDVRDAQGEEGDYSNVAPRVISNAPGAPAWGDAGIIVPYHTWKFYGDQRVLTEMWDSMEAWMKYIYEGNQDYLWMNRRGNDFGDWVPADSTTDKGLIATAYWAGNARMMSEMAAALGKAEKVAEYDKLYGNIRAAFQKEFIKPDGKIANGSQTCYVLALENELVQDELVEKAVEHLLADIAERNNHLSTGFLGTTHLLPVLVDHGQMEMATTLLLNKTYPSWGYMVEKGATTIWERWNSDTGDPSMNSFNHYIYGAVTDWLYEYVAGIGEAAPGFQEILIEPHTDPRLSFVRATYESVHGLIKSGWELEGDTLKLDVKIPANTTAKFSLPTTDAAGITVNGKTLEEAGIESSRVDDRTQFRTGAGSYKVVIMR